MNYSYNLLHEKVPITDDLTIESLEGTTLLVPNNCLELIVPMDGIVELKMVGGIRSAFLSPRSAYFIRPRRKSMILVGHTDYVRVKCHPGYTRYIVRRLGELANGVFEAQLSETQLDELLFIEGELDFSQVSDRLEAYFDLYSSQPSDLLLNSMALMKTSCGSITIKDVYTELQVSKSTLEQRFNCDIGLTPKEFCKIEKLNHFIKMYRRKTQVSLTEITYQCGYYDQSHLIKDFRYFMDMSPRKYFA